MKPRRGHCRPTTEPAQRMRSTPGRGCGRGLHAATGCALLLAGAAAARAQEPRATADASAPGPETEILGQGRHEGPRLWRGRKAGPTLWVPSAIPPPPEEKLAGH